MSLKWDWFNSETNWGWHCLSSNIFCASRARPPKGGCLVSGESTSRLHVRRSGEPRVTLVLLKGVLFLKLKNYIADVVRQPVYRSKSTIVPY